MNHSNKQKNFNKSAGHRRLMFSNMVESFKKSGFVTTTQAKGKYLKNILQSELQEDKIFVVKLPTRKGDNAAMVRMVSANYAAKKFKTKEKTNAKSN